MIILYLSAVVLANLSAGYFGPAVTPINAFLLIGLAITTRDALHDRWGDKVRWRMASIILAGGGLSYLLGEPRIAVASAVAFVVSEASDYFTYCGLIERSWLQRSNGSNVVSSVVDSFLFPTLAFGVLLPGIIAGQIVAKIGGGWIWSLVIQRWKSAAAMALVVVAAPVEGQIFSLGVGAVVTESGEEPTLELFTATPPLGRLRFTSVIATNDHGEVTYIGKFSFGATPWLSIESGASWLKFRNYDPEWFVGVFFRRRLSKTLKLGVAISSEPEQDWNTVAVVKVDFWTWFRR